MGFLRYFSPITAWRDLKRYFTARKPHQLGFLGLAAALSYLMITQTLAVSHVPPPPYHRDIVYVQQWRADRTDAEIVAQQKIDSVQVARDKAELKRLEAERRAQFKRLDDQLKSVGI